MKCKNSIAISTERRTWLKQIGGLGLAASLPVMAIAEPKRRIVSVGAAITEIIYDLHAQSDIIAVDTTSIYPAEATKLPQIGYARTLSAENIIALAPTQFIGTEEAGPPDVLQKIKNAGIPVTILNAHYRYEDAVERIITLGKIINKNNEADALANIMKAQWTTLQARIKDNPIKPRILFVLSHSPNQIMVAGQHTGAESIIQYANGINAIDGFQGYKTLTPEAVISAQPDIVLFTTQGIDAMGGVENALRIPGISQTNAGKYKRILALDAVYMLGFGPRMPEAVNTLHQDMIKIMKKS